MKRFLTLNELIEDLQKYQKDYGNKEISSIGACSDGNYYFYMKEEGCCVTCIIHSKELREE